MTKKHAPIEKLREAKKEADRLMIDKYKVRAKESVIDTIEATHGEVTLPGIPSYLPFPWTINATRRILYDIARLWQLHTEKENLKSEDVTEFFKFVLNELRETTGIIEQLMAKTVRDKKFDTRYLHQREAVAGVKKFLVDSFAVSVLEKQNSSVSDYLEWFFDWTDSLLAKYAERSRSIDGKTKSGIILPK
jgi:hypothetical protein